MNPIPYLADNEDENGRLPTDRVSELETQLALVTAERDELIVVRASLSKQLDDAREALEKAKADSERLDWLENSQHTQIHPRRMGIALETVMGKVYEAPNLRAAIDAARLSATAPKPNE